MFPIVDKFPNAFPWTFLYLSITSFPMNGAAVNLSFSFRTPSNSFLVLNVLISGPLKINLYYQSLSLNSWFQHVYKGLPKILCTIQLPDVLTRCLIFLLLFLGLIFSFHFWFRDLLRELDKKYEVLLIISGCSKD